MLQCDIIFEIVCWGKNEPGNLLEQQQNNQINQGIMFMELPEIYLLMHFTPNIVHV